MKSSVFCGLVLFCLFAAVMFINTFCPGDATIQQQYNATVTGTIAGCIGIGLLYYSRRKRYKIL